MVWCVCVVVIITNQLEYSETLITISAVPKPRDFNMDDKGFASLFLHWKLFVILPFSSTSKENIGVFDKGTPSLPPTIASQ